VLKNVSRLWLADCAWLQVFLDGRLVRVRSDYTEDFRVPNGTTSMPPARLTFGLTPFMEHFMNPMPDYPLSTFVGQMTGLVRPPWHMFQPPIAAIGSHSNTGLPSYLLLPFLPLSSSLRSSFHFTSPPFPRPPVVARRFECGGGRGALCRGCWGWRRTGDSEHDRSPVRWSLGRAQCHHARSSE